MFRVLKLKLIIIVVAVVAVVGVLTIILPTFNNASTTISQIQNSNIEEKYIKDVIVEPEDEQNNATDKDLNSFTDIQNSSDNSESNNGHINKPETISPKLENSNNSNNINKQENINSNLEKSSNSNDISKKEASSSNPEKLYNNNGKNKQEAINSNLEILSNSNNANKQTTDNSQLKAENSNMNTQNKENTNAAVEVKSPTFRYDRTTTIYANDNITLLRVEYYTNNKLTYYSVVEQFNATTKSYVEKIYQCNLETNIDPLIRTDIYVNGILTKSY